MSWDDRLDALLAAGGPPIVFQPIVRLADGHTVGYEALARFGDYTPDVWFRSAHLLGRTLELELAAARNALACCGDLPDACYLSINASPSLLADRDFEDTIVTSGCDRGRLMIEVTEHEAVADYRFLAAVLAPLRDHGATLGVRLAIDDVGAGFASLRHLVDLHPDLIKLDISLVRGVDVDDTRRALCFALVGFAQRVRMDVAAEGVETDGELTLLEVLGVQYAQGFLLGRPGPLP